MGRARRETLTLLAATQLYVMGLRELGTAPGTVRTYAGVLRRLTARLPGKSFTDLYTPDLFNAMFGPGGISTGRAVKTVNLQRAAIKSFLEYGCSAGWRRDMIAVPKAPVRSNKEPAAGLRTRLTSDQLLTLLHGAAHPILRGMLAVAMNTALRVSDVQKILIGDVDLATGDLNVVTLKTGVADMIPLTLDLDDELRRYLKWLTGATGLTVLDVDAHMFPGFAYGFNERGYEPTRPVSYNWANRGLGALYAACGVRVEPRERWHTIRRSVARIYFDSLRDQISHDHAIRQTMTLLGHRAQSTTETYLGLDAEKSARDESLRGKRLIVPGGNVVTLHRPNAS